MTDNELLLAMSVLMDKKLKPIENRLDRVENKAANIFLTLENDIRPRLSTIEICYTDKLDGTFSDVELLKKVVNEHSEKMQK